MTTITGATRLNVIVGDPIAQVKSPAGMTAAFTACGHDGVVVPVRVSAADLGDFLRVADRLPNLDGIIVTVPHKFACRKHCASVTERGAFLNAVNLLRRRARRTLARRDSRWSWIPRRGEGAGLRSFRQARAPDRRRRRGLGDRPRAC